MMWMRSIKWREARELLRKFLLKSYGTLEYELPEHKEKLKKLICISHEKLWEDCQKMDRVPPNLNGEIVVQLEGKILYMLRHGGGRIAPNSGGWVRYEDLQTQMMTELSSKGEECDNVVMIDA